MLFVCGYLATQMNSRNVESERYTDYFNPMPDISNDAFPKKPKSDNGNHCSHNARTPSVSQILNFFFLQFTALSCVSLDVIKSFIG